MIFWILSEIRPSFVASTDIEVKNGRIKPPMKEKTQKAFSFFTHRGRLTDVTGKLGHLVFLNKKTKCIVNNKIDKNTMYNNIFYY